MQFRPFGRNALLVEVDDAVAALSLATWARSLPVDAIDIVPAACTVLFDGVRSRSALVEVLRGWTAGTGSPAGGFVEIPVVYDGPDLEFLAGAWGLSCEGVVARHGEIEFEAAFCGFVPGFSYLRGLPDDLAVPRLDSPRPKVPAGSVALAGAWCGIYPQATPGGWRVLGRTDAVLWDQERAQPALLPPGTSVRFVPA